jgi:signal transduction histidine kinase
VIVEQIIEPAMFVKRLSWQPHPFGLLLVLEWILLGLSALKLVGTHGWFGSWVTGESGIQPIDVFWLTCILVVFTLMGLRLPGSQLAKRLYTAIELGLIIGAATLLGWNLDVLSPLLVVVLIRSCLIFGRTGQWVISGLMLLVYPLSLAPIAVIFWFLLDPKMIHEWTSNQPDLMVITPEGGIQINFTPEQVRQFLAVARNFFWQILINHTLSFALVLIFVLLSVDALIRERRGRRQLALAHEQLYQYSLQIDDQATLQERNRIAREIHDALGHLLTAQNIQLQNALLSLTDNPAEAKPFVEDSQRLGANALQEVRQAVMMLRSEPLQGQSLEAAIGELVKGFNAISTIVADCQITLDIALPTRIQVAIYRILEEALTNVYKYSGATQVSICLKTEPVKTALAQSAAQSLTSRAILEIVDNGRGFNPAQNSTGFGLRGMQERAASLGGQIQITSEPNAGCRVIVVFPLPSTAV